MDSGSVDEFFRRGARNGHVSSLWTAARMATRRQTLKPLDARVDTHMAALMADGVSDPAADDPILRASFSEDPLLQGDCGFVQRTSPLTRKMSVMVVLHPGAMPPPAARRKSPTGMPRPARKSPSELLRGLPSAISKSALGSRRSPRIVSMRESPKEAGLTPGLSPGRTPKAARRQSKAKRWMSALGKLPSCYIVL